MTAVDSTDRASSRSRTGFAIEVSSLAAATAGSALLKAALAGMVAQSYGARSFGWFSAAWAVSYAAVALADAGISDWILYAFRRGEDVISAWRALQRRAIASMAGVALFGVIVWSVASAREASWTGLVAPLLLLHAAYAVQMWGQSLLRAALRNRAVGLFRLLQFPGSVAMIAALWLSKPELHFAIWVYAIFETAVAVTILSISRPSGRADEGSSPTTRSASQGAFVASALAVFVYLSSDAVILAFSRSSDEAGLYGAGYRIYTLAIQASGLLVATLLPTLFGVGDRTLQVQLGRRLERMQSAASAIIALLLIGGAPWIIAAYVGPGFDVSADVLRVLGLSAILKGLGFLPVAMLQAFGRQQLRARVQIAAAGINLGLNLVLIPRIGLWAAVWTTVATDLFLLLAYTVAARTAHSEGSWPRLRAAVPWVSIILAALVMSVASVPGSTALVLAVVIALVADSIRSRAALRELMSLIAEARRVKSATA